MEPAILAPPPAGDSGRGSRLYRGTVLAPSCGTAFHESFARQSYRNAANRPGVAGDTRELLYLLAETLPLARASLNRMTDRCLI